MSNPLSALDMSAFALGGVDMLALLRTFAIDAQVTTANAAGLAERYPFMIGTKQYQKIPFTVFQVNGLDVPQCNLDVSVYSIGGTDYLGQMRSGSINVQTAEQERSSLANSFRIPNANGTSWTVNCDLLVVSEAALTGLVINGTQAELAVTVILTFGPASFEVPCILSASNYKVDRGMMQMESVTLEPQGTPTGPNDSTLLGVILMGSSALTVSADTGGKTYSGNALMGNLRISFADEALTEFSGNLDFQNGMTIGAP